MQPRRLSILGVGLLGGSIGLAVRAKVTGCRIVGYAHRRSTLTAAVACGAIDEGYEDPARAVRDADLVILCTPVGTFDSLLQSIAPALMPGALVTDVGSTKKSIVSAAQRSLPKNVNFVGSHPMAGSEKRGVQFARPDLYQGALCIVTPTDDTNAEALHGVESFWQLLGMRTTRLAPEEHDRLLADVSHLPHAVAAALVTLQDDAALALAGNGFLDATRIAAGDGGLWRDILIDNRDNVLKSIRRIQEQLEALRQLLDPQRAEALRQWLDAAASRRQQLGKEKMLNEEC